MGKNTVHIGLRENGPGRGKMVSTVVLKVIGFV